MTKKFVAPPGKEGLVKAIKRKGTNMNPWAVAWSKHNKEKKMSESEVFSGSENSGWTQEEVAAQMAGSTVKDPWRESIDRDVDRRQGMPQKKRKKKKKWREWRHGRTAGGQFGPSILNKGKKKKKKRSGETRSSDTTR
jgi:hypothetical protein